jgi:hypothetical protein
MKASLPLLQPDSHPVGAMDEESWSAAQDLLVKAGFQKSRVESAKAFTTKYLK